MNDTPSDKRGQELRHIRLLIWVFICGLALSGASAIPLETELKILGQWFSGSSPAAQWFQSIRDAYIETSAKHPFIGYGTDWLAFGHFVIAVAFFGPLRDPVKNIWVIELGMIACVMVIPFAFIMGGWREIPIGWRLVDCSFGLFGFIPLYFCHKGIKRLVVGTNP